MWLYNPQYSVQYIPCAMYSRVLKRNVTQFETRVLPAHGNETVRVINPLPLLFKALLHGQKDRVFFSGHLIYILKQERFRAFRLAGDI
jgi:hypothetical protein